MERDPSSESSPPANGAAATYEAPKVESVLSANDLEREVMHGVISQS